MLLAPTIRQRSRLVWVDTPHRAPVIFIAPRLPATTSVPAEVPIRPSPPCRALLLQNSLEFGKPGSSRRKTIQRQFGKACDHNSVRHTEGLRSAVRPTVDLLVAGPHSRVTNPTRLNRRVPTLFPFQSVCSITSFRQPGFVSPRIVFE